MKAVSIIVKCEADGYTYFTDAWVAVSGETQNITIDPVHRVPQGKTQGVPIRWDKMPAEVRNEIQRIAMPFAHLHPPEIQ